MKCTQCVGLAAAALVVIVLLTGSARVQAGDTAQITGGIVDYNRKYRIGAHLKFRVTHTTTGDDFDALVGPLPNAGVGAYTVFEAEENLTGGVTKINMAISGQDGFIYMSGVQPYGGTDGGSAAGEGTTMIVQRITIGGTIYHRYFRLEATDPVNVTNCDDPLDTKTIAQNYKYVERTNGDLSNPILIPTRNDPDPNGIRRFVMDVLFLAYKAEILPLPTIP